MTQFQLNTVRWHERQRLRCLQRAVEAAKGRHARAVEFAQGWLRQAVGHARHLTKLAG